MTEFEKGYVAAIKDYEDKLRRALENHTPIKLDYNGQERVVFIISDLEHLKMMM